MQSEIRYKPAFAAIFVTLKPGDSIIAEAGAMTSMDAQLSMTTEFSGGFFSALLKKFFGNESLFVNKFVNNTNKPLQLVLSQTVIGDIEQINLDNQEIYLQAGAYIASTPDVKIGVRWAGISSLIAGEGLFKLKLSGRGQAWFGDYGGISKKMVNGDFIVDNSHLIAYEAGLSMKIKLSGGLFSSLTSGEGLVNKLSGKGTVYLQSRSIDGLVSYLRTKIK